MDRVTRRSGYVSLVLHGVLVAASLFALGPPPPPPPPPARVPDASAPPPTPAQVLAPLGVAAKDAVPPASAPRLPQLGPESSPPPLPIVLPMPTDRQGGGRSRGKAGPDPAPVDLPTAAGESPMLRALRGIHTNQSLSHEQDMQATAQSHLQKRLVDAYRSRWRAYATQVSNRTLVVELVVDRRGRVQRGRLFQCTTGSPDLDRAIEAWLMEKDFGLPPIAPGMLWFLVTLP